MDAIKADLELSRKNRPEDVHETLEISALLRPLPAL